MSLPGELYSKGKLTILLMRGRVKPGFNKLFKNDLF